METAGQLDHLIRLIYAAPGTFDGWHAVLDALCVAFNGSAGNLISHHNPGGDLAQTNIAVTARTDPSALALYQGHWHRHDPWLTSPMTPTLREGDVVVGDQLISRTALRNGAFYNEFSRRFDIADDLAAMIECGPNQLSVISINGSAGRPAFGEADATLLRALMPHLSNAVRLHRRITTADEQISRLAAVTNALTVGVLWISKDGRILGANDAAGAFLSQRDGLEIARGVLCAATAADQAAVRRAIRDAMAGGRGRLGGGTTSVKVSRPSGRRPWLLVVGPAVPDSHSQAGLDTAARVFVTDLEGRCDLPQERVAALFGLTAAETRVAVELASGASLKEISETLYISLHTTRFHLKRIFDKTQTARQGELVRLLQQLASTLRA